MSITVPVTNHLNKFKKPITQYTSQYINIDCKNVKIIVVLMNAYIIDLNCGDYQQ